MPDILIMSCIGRQSFDLSLEEGTRSGRVGNNRKDQMGGKSKHYGAPTKQVSTDGPQSQHEVFPPMVQILQIVIREGWRFSLSKAVSCLYSELTVGSTFDETLSQITGITRDEREARR
jgi:hypothetical protein